MDTNNNVNNNENEEVKNVATENTEATNEAPSSEEHPVTKNVLEMDEEKGEVDQA